MVREDGKRDRVSMKASSTVIGLEASVTDGGRGGWSKRGFAVIRRVVRPGKTVGIVLRMVQELMLLRDRSRERRAGGNWKYRVVSVVF